MSKRRHLTLMIIWAALLIVAVVLLWNRLFMTDVAAPDKQRRTQADEQKAATHTSATLSRLVGRWERPDGGYVLDIKAVHDDGRVDATYLNPRPINISKAETITKGGHVILVVTLQDRGYPGNIYTLTYDPHADSLEGVYYHQGLKQRFDVEFSRLRSEQNTQ